MFLINDLQFDKHGLLIPGYTFNINNLQVIQDKLVKNKIRETLYDFFLEYIRDFQNEFNCERIVMLMDGSFSCDITFRPEPSDIDFLIILEAELTEEIYEEELEVLLKKFFREDYNDIGSDYLKKLKMDAFYLMKYKEGGEVPSDEYEKDLKYYQDLYSKTKELNLPKSFITLEI